MQRITHYLEESLHEFALALGDFGESVTEERSTDPLVPLLKFLRLCGRQYQYDFNQLKSAFFNACLHAYLFGGTENLKKLFDTLHAVSGYSPRVLRQRMKHLPSGFGGGYLEAFNENDVLLNIQHLVAKIQEQADSNRPYYSHLREASHCWLGCYTSEQAELLFQSLEYVATTENETISLLIEDGEDTRVCFYDPRENQWTMVNSHNSAEFRDTGFYSEPNLNEHLKANLRPYTPILCGVTPLFWDARKAKKFFEALNQCPAFQRANFIKFDEMTQREINILVTTATKRGDVNVLKQFFAVAPRLVQFDSDEVRILCDELLTLAVLKNQYKSVSCLIKAGADVNNTSFWGVEKITPLIIAAREGYASIFQLLLQKKADIFLAPLDGWNAALSAAYWGHTSILRILHHNGVNLNFGTHDGLSLLDLAKLNKDNNQKTIAFLEGLKAQQNNFQFFSPIPSPTSSPQPERAARNIFSPGS